MQAVKIAIDFTPLKNCEGSYSISKCGQVYSHLSNKTIATSIGKKGYRVFNASISGRKQTVYLHRALAETFLGVVPFEGAQVNHIDGNKLNNALSNLEWISPGDNIRHAWKNGLCTPHWGGGFSTASRKLTNEQLEDVKNKLLSGVTQSEVAREYNLNQSTVSRMKNGLTYNHN